MEFNKMTVKQLKQFASNNGICLVGYTLKTDIIEKIEKEYKIIQRRELESQIIANKDINDPNYIINCFLTLSGKKLIRAMEINENIFMNKTAGKKWYFTMCKKIHPDTCKLENAQNAFEKLNKYYNDFIK